MQRIGIAASKIAKGNLWLYNFCVIIIAFLCSLFIFFLAGSSIILALIIIGHAVSGVLPAEFGNDWTFVMRVCMITLTVVVSILNLFAILRNIKIK